MVSGYHQSAFRVVDGEEPECTTSRILRPWMGFAFALLPQELSDSFIGRLGMTFGPGVKRFDVQSKTVLIHFGPGLIRKTDAWGLDGGIMRPPSVE